MTKNYFSEYCLTKMKAGSAKVDQKRIMKDKINPDHYKVGGLEVIDIMKAKLSPTQFAGFCKGNVIKYVLRADHKGKLEDLKKAKWYLETLINEVEK